MISIPSIVLLAWQEHPASAAAAECPARHLPSASSGESSHSPVTPRSFPLFQQHFQLLGPKCLRPAPSHTVVLSGMKGTDAANVFCFFLSNNLVFQLKYIIYI